MLTTETIVSMDTVRRLHWGCGKVTPAGWINSDLAPHPGVDIVGDILKGLPLEDDSIDYISSQHVLVELEIWDQKAAMRELRRVLKPGGVLRLGLPDFERAIASYQSGSTSYFEHWWDTPSGNLITQILWHSYIRTLFTYEFAEELLLKSGFREVRRVAYRQTTSDHPDIVNLDNREGESFFVEAFK